jgi:hypothetical protein
MPTVHLPMALAAEGHKILWGIVAQQTSRSDVVHLEGVRAATALAVPSISLQYLSAQLTIGMQVEPNSWAPRSN